MSGTIRLLAPASRMKESHDGKTLGLVVGNAIKKGKSVSVDMRSVVSLSLVCARAYVSEILERSTRAEYCRMVSVEGPPHVIQQIENAWATLTQR